MTVLEKIMVWSKELPPWQSDALRRLFLRRDLSDDDYADLVALAKKHKGIPDSSNRVAVPLSNDHIPVSSVDGAPVILHSLADLKNVNALADSQELKFAERGVTVIYGDNGSGKSGYARVLKRACRARDDESVLPNAALPKARHGKPEATVTVSKGKDVKKGRWVEGQPSPELLSTLSVFDNHCARVYLDDESDIAFMPYGLDLVEDLGKACVQVREHIQKENESIKVDLSVFDDLKGPTKVGSQIAALSERTDTKAITALATISSDERKRIDELEMILKEGNPLEKAKTLRATATRLARLADACGTFGVQLADAAAARLKGIDEAFVAAQKTSDLVVKGLREDPGMLPGTGGKEWRSLLAAAQTFSDEAYPGHRFPHVGDGAKCVLCQQDLTEGKDRYRKFGEFLINVAEEELRKAAANLRTAENETKSVKPALPMDEELLADIRAADQTLGDICQVFGMSLAQRQGAFLKALAEHSWPVLEPLAESPGPALKLLSESLAANAKALEDSVDKAVREKLVQEQLEFKVREQLGPRKEAILRSIEKLQLKGKLAASAAAIDTTAISRKAKALTQESVSEVLANTLNNEFASLGVDHLNVTYGTRAAYGKTLQKLKLNFPGSSDIARVLSEGEQRALAIASFLAEISLAPGSSGLIFDDPVSSLDHLRREKVAARFVNEGAKRQIVIFTHDLYFLGLLTSEAAKQQIPILCQSILKHGENIGLLSPDLPFAGQNTKQRIGHLKQRIQEIATAKRAGNHPASEALIKDGYDLLRQAWERAVEEILLQGVVERFERGVHTQKLSGVKVEDEDWIEVSNAMSRCSTFTGHDRPRTGGTMVLDSDAFEVDVLALEVFQKRIAARTEGLRSARRAVVTKS